MLARELKAQEDAQVAQAVHGSATTARALYLKRARESSLNGAGCSRRSLEEVHPPTAPPNTNDQLY